MGLIECARIESGGANYKLPCVLVHGCGRVVGGGEGYF